jgi:hypothetical protein
LCCLSFFFWSLCCLSFFFWSLCCLSLDNTMAKRKSTNGQQRSTKHTHKTK